MINRYGSTEAEARILGSYVTTLPSVCSLLRSAHPFLGNVKELQLPHCSALLLIELLMGHGSHFSCPSLPVTSLWALPLVHWPWLWT
ncbi:hypothetical protein SETIT_8G213800v2 [Setaria italica]|uniref:Uncharacterized protein n=1 Tax=Setaria italica TaxID=4555 RepID=A0A368SA47_SETIT|nr:hypothetical protein SETIT_8G213800v2 [Setaria italica]